MSWGKRKRDGQAYPKKQGRVYGTANTDNVSDMRRRHTEQRRRDKAIHSPHLKKTLIEERDGMKIYSVDGAFVRDHIDDSFTQGDHAYDKGSWVPDGEIWIDKDVPDRRPLIEHEVYEAKRMRKGENYEKAHAAALEYEKKYRPTKEPTPLAASIKDEKQAQQEYKNLAKTLPPSDATKVRGIAAQEAQHEATLREINARNT